MNPLAFSCCITANACSKSSTLRTPAGTSVTPQPPGSLLRGVQPEGIDGRGGGEEHPEARALRQGLFEQLQVLAIDFRPGHDRHSRNVAPRTRETLGESKGNRLFGTRHDDRDLRRRLLHRRGDSVGAHHKHLDVEGGEFGGERGQPLGSAIRISPLNRNILAFDVAQLPQTLRDYLELPRGGSRRTSRQKPDFGDLPRRLGHGGQQDSGGEGEDDKDCDGATLHGVVLQNIQQDHQPEECSAPV